MSSAPAHLNSSITFCSQGYPGTYCLSVFRGDNTENICCHSPGNEGELVEAKEHTLIPDINRISCTWIPSNPQISPYCVSVDLSGYKPSTVNKIIVTIQPKLGPLGEDGVSLSFSTAAWYPPGRYSSSISPNGEKIVFSPKGYAMKSLNEPINPEHYCQHLLADKSTDNTVDVIPPNAVVRSYTYISKKVDDRGKNYARNYLQMRNNDAAN